VAVLDTGINFIHPELKCAILDKELFSNSQAGTTDIFGHGTHVAGIIAAKRDYLGVVGVAPAAQLLIGKIADDDNAASPAALADAINWAVKSEADIINISFYSMEEEANTECLRKAIDDAANAGVFIICAASNEGTDGVGYPAKYDNCMAVGALDKDLFQRRSSGKGPELDLLAPGENIWSTYLGSGYAKLSGTSMAAPFISGVAALILAKHRKYGGATPVRTIPELLEHLEKISTRFIPGQTLSEMFAELDERMKTDDVFFSDQRRLLHCRQSNRRITLGFGQRLEDRLKAANPDWVPTNRR
jgi:subtilisin family serine protease